MGIDLRGRQIAVTQQHLHHPQIGAMIEQMGGKGMAQGVRRQALGDTGDPGLQLDPVPEGLPGHLLATQAGKQHVTGLVAQQ
ncbi:hypothetical protein D3C86_2076950 [compost metagenome]